MRVGHGSAPIEVHAGEPLGGYIARVGGLSGLLDPLEVHAISFSADDRRFVLVVVDVVCVNEDVVAAIRERCEGDGSVVWVSATHTHAAPESGCHPGGASTPPSVADRLVSAAVSAVETAVGDERSARIRAVRAYRDGVASRRTGPSPEGVDLPLDAVFVSDHRTDAVQGVLVITSVHPTILAAENTEASADLSGAIRRASAQQWGGWAVAATGAAGDISTRGARRGRDAAELTRVAGLMIDALADAARDPAGSAPHDGVVQHGLATGELAANTLEVDHLVSPTGADEEAARWREVYEHGRQALIELGGHHGREPLPLAIEAAAVGPVRFVGIPGEPFLELGERIHEATGCIVLGCTNGYLGYLPVADIPTTYETIISPVDAAATEEVVRLGIAAAGALRP